MQWEMTAQLPPDTPDRRYSRSDQSRVFRPRRQIIEFWIARFLVAFETIACTLAFPTYSFAADCYCSDRCNHANTILGYQTCINNCQLSCPKERRKKSVFGAIAYAKGDGYFSIGRQGPSAKEVETDTLEHCRTNSKQPATCELAASYKNSCGGLAVGSKGYWYLGEGGKDTGKRSAADAKSLLLTSCEQDGATDCRILASSCANDKTAEERAQDDAAAAAILDAIGSVLKWGLENLDSPSTSGRRPTPSRKDQ